MTVAARAGATTLVAAVMLLANIAPVHAADLCADAKTLGKRLKNMVAPTSADWLVLAKAFQDCRDHRNRSGIPYDEESEYISGQIANSYQAAFVDKQSEVTSLIQNAALRKEERDDAMSKLKTTQERVAELEARPNPAPLVPLREPAYQRLAFRIETGFSTGHLTRVGFQGRSSHSGGFLQLSLLPRFSFHDGRLAVLLGPFYSFWRANLKDGTINTNHTDAREHSFGGKLELDLGLWRKIDRWLTVHPSLEMGLDYVRFDSNLTMEGNLVPSYLDRIGFVVAGNLNICVWEAVGCISARLKSVPGQVSVPTTQVGVGFDPMRLVAAIKGRRARSAQ
jgi:hypothetical protein